MVWCGAVRCVCGWMLGLEEGCDVAGKVMNEVDRFGRWGIWGT